MNDKKTDVLIAGAGPAAIQTAVCLAKEGYGQVGMVNRTGVHSNVFEKQLKENGSRVNVSVIQERLAAFSGETHIDFYNGYEKVPSGYKKLILCTPSDTYIAVLSKMERKVLAALHTITLISPGTGSAMLVKGFMMSLGFSPEVISFSSYFAATKFNAAEDYTGVRTKAAKKVIYAASSRKNSPFLKAMEKSFKNLGIRCRLLEHPIEAEARSITAYVHPPLFINEFSLEVILNPDHHPLKSMYKLYPEGPVTQESIRSMVRLWKELSKVYTAFGAEPVNLLKFLNDDNYPVLPQSISRRDIEDFEKLDPVRQEYLLYVRYASLLIDPHSVPDEQGRYFEFSKVGYPAVSREIDGSLCLPRLPLEDYKNLKRAAALGRQAGIEMPEAERLVQLFERRVSEYYLQHQTEPGSFIVSDEAIMQEIKLMTIENRVHCYE